MASDYYNGVRAILTDICSTQAESIGRAANLIVSSFLDGNNFWLYGTGSHSGLMVAEAIYRAGGLVVANPVFDPYAMRQRKHAKGNLLEPLKGYASILLEDSGVENGDTLLVVSNSGTSVAVEILSNVVDRHLTGGEHRWGVRE
jgi:uncharacterized phosphosugar-binding protein